ncbi:hypothetical protein DAPPUDRAFT_304120 [Daphnia pulex]|uniref:Cytochrome b561 domain-containing protein n=1 Tax=Daphnia pulex TaxID=6669 RepID=E9GJC9_DAPPU|nr:hypothetical protein DAPPUDRAFT_304120 [Daphnia pulex]|eukprot:EFX80429.1 hypothetical protein DAPPUDRAFT_304120 [Daphnia pulex]
MKWPIVQSAVLLLTVFGIHLSTGYETSKPFTFPDDDPYYPPAVPFANNPKAPPPIIITTITTPKIPAQPTPFAQVSPQVFSSVYDGCDGTKGCLGYPASCIQQRSCSALVTFAQKGQRSEFELWATKSTDNSFVAVGFSEDNKMGDDSVTECTMANGRVNVYMSQNDASKTNIRLPNPTEGLNVISTTFSDGNLYCKFERTSQFVLGGKKLDASQKFFLLLARGPASNDGIAYHGSEKTVSDRSLKLSETGAVGASKGTLVKLHGIFMVTAWMLAASCGLLLARYYKLTWVGQQIMGKDLWFVYHTILMMVTWTLTMIAFILIFSELGGWTSIPAKQNPHAVIGLITTLLAFIQPIMAYFRPHPDGPRRYIFNWAHWLVGKAAHVLGVVCIFLAVGLDKAAIPYWVTWLIVVYSVIYILSHIILTLSQCFMHAPWRPRPTTSMAMKDMLPPRESYQDSLNLAKNKEDAYGSQFRRVYLFFYVLLVTSFSIAVIATIAKAPWPKQ